MYRKFTKCPRCGEKLIRSQSWNGGESEFWFECVACNTYVNSYIPQEHQHSLHEDPHRYIGNFGGYGTGKTLTSRQELYKHCFITPHANALIGANTVSQYEQTIKREIENDLPRAFYAGYSVQKSYFDLLNGARIIYRPLADPGRLRSYNLTFFVIVEASEVPTETFSQAKTRLRNMNAAKQAVDAFGEPVFEYDKRGVALPVYEYDWRKGIVESNPDSGWIRTEVVLAADKINKHGSVLDDFRQIAEEVDPVISCHISSTDVNKYLPKDFIKEITKNKPGWWVSRYVLGSFSYAEGLVYPRAIDFVVPHFEVPNHWKRIIAFDYGIRDRAVYIFGAVDKDEGILYIYKEAVTTEQNVQQLARLYFENIADIPSGGMVGPPIIDPKSVAKRDYNLKTLGDHFLEEGIAFEPGYVNLDARIFRLNTYFESGRLRIMDSCRVLIEELSEYKFAALTLDKKIGKQKPIDKDNHAINPLEWIVMRLPADPKNLILGVYDWAGRELNDPKKTKQDWMPWALRDDYDDTFEREPYSHSNYGRI